ELFLHVLHEPTQFEHEAAGESGDAGLGAVTAGDGLRDQRPQSRILEAPRSALGKIDEIGAPLLRNKCEQRRVPGDAPAIKPQGRRIEAHRSDLAWMARGVVDGQDRTHREAAHDDGATVRSHAPMLVLDGRIPILPACNPKILNAAAMAGQLRDTDRVSGARESLRDVAHLDRRAAQAMDQQEPGASSGEAYAVLIRAHVSSLPAPIVRALATGVPAGRPAALWWAGERWSPARRSGWR